MYLMTLVAFLMALSFSAPSSHAEGVPMSEWTEAEQKWVNEARALYQSQGVEFSDAQAQEAVSKIRNKTAKGVPPSEWTPLEQKMVTEMRALYKQRNLTLTDEQERIQVQTMREKIAKVNGSVSVLKGLADGSIKPSPTPVASTNFTASNSQTSLSEDMLAVKLNEAPKGNAPVEITGRKDGFNINGRGYADAEGRIASYGFDSVTGDVTYLVNTPSDYAIKWLRATADHQPLLLAKASRMNNNTWEVTTTTGKKLSGSHLIMSSQGFVVGREASAFRYIPGKGVSSILIPEGYSLAAFQHGDVSSGYILLEKSYEAGSGKDLEALTSSIKALGSTLGLNKKEDYALMNTESGKLFPLNIEFDGKSVTQMSGCRKKNWLINECSHAMTFESLYTSDGTPNMSHYFWRIHWFKTPSGPMAISLENGVKDLYITELNTGKKVVGFNRLLGIQHFQTKQYADGHVALFAHWAFTAHEIPDIEKYIATAPLQP